MRPYIDRPHLSRWKLLYTLHWLRLRNPRALLQGKLAVCFANCAEEYEGKLDKLKVDIAADLSRLTSRLH